jgi:phage terminase large subunit-like protein
MDRWKLCTTATPETAMAWRKQMLQSLRGRECWAGLDLGATSDLCAFALWFPGDGDDKDILLPWFWCPKDAIWQRSQRDRVPYDVWERQGWIKTAGEASVRYPIIRADINDLAEAFLIKEIAVDRLFQGAQLSTELMEDGFEVVTFGQGFFSMAAPVKRFLELVAESKIDHGCNPILTWMAGNAATQEDPAGNQKWDKARSSEKIDGIVGATMALGRVMVSPVGSFTYESGDMWG